MASKIILKKSNVASKVPVVGDLDYGELALNYTDGKLWYKNNSNVITQLNALVGTVPVSQGGTGQTSYTPNGVLFAGSGGTTLSTSSQVTFGGTALDLNDINLSINKSTGIPAQVIYSNQASGYAPALLQLYRSGASGSSTPNASVIGEIRWDAISPGVPNAYDNVAMIKVTIGNNATGGAPSSMGFFTAANGANATERMTLDALGNLNIAGLTASKAIFTDASKNLTTTGTVAVAQGGTGLTTIAARSIAVANTADTYTTVTPGAGQSIRINAGNTAWEAYTPGTGGTSTWTKKTSSYTAVSGDKLICDTTGGAFSITLPATPTTGSFVELTDGGDWFTTNLTVLRNGSTVEGGADDVLLNVKGVTAYFIYDGTTWQVTATLGKQGNTGSTGTFDTSSSVVFTAPQSFTASGILLKGTSTGYTTFASANTTATAYTVTFPAETMTVGYRNVPPVGTKTSTYTLALADVGKYVQVSTGGSILIPNSIFAEGDIVSVFNNTAGTINIGCDISVAYIAGTNVNKANVTLATRGTATILFTSAISCVISGNVS